MPPATITLIDPQGEAREVSAEAAGGALEQGWRVPTETDRLARLGEQAKEADYGGAAGAVNATIAGGMRGATLSGSDVLMRALGGEQSRIDLENLRDVHQAGSIGGEIVGTLAATALSGGALTPAGAAARLGRGITELGAEAGALGRIGAATAGGAAEGGLYGLGTGISELALSDDPLTLEHVASTLSSNALFGAATGGIASGTLKAAELGLGRAKVAIDDALERRASAKARTPAEAVDAGDLGSLDKKTLDLLEEEEVARIAKEQAPQREAAVSELDKWRRGNRDAHDLREITKSSVDADTREASGAFDRANFRLRAMLDDRVGLAKDPSAALPFLRKQTQALEEMRLGALSEQARWRVDVETAPQRIREEIQAGRVSGELGPFTPAGLDLAVERVTKEMQGLYWGGAVTLGLKEPSLSRRIPAIEEMLARNRGFQSQLEALAQTPTSARLSKIAEAREALGAPKEPSLGRAVFDAAAPFAGPIGAAAQWSSKAVGGLRKAGAAAATKTAEAASAFLGVASKAAGKAAPYAPAVATKVLGAISYAPPAPSQPRGAGQKAEPAPPATSLAGVYKKRTDEIKSQVHIAPDGTFQMRAEARERMAARLAPVRAVDPRAADQLETMAARRLEYLASIMPRLPDFGTVQIGPERRRVSDQDMRTWARAAGALEDPDGVFERAKRGKVHPAEAAALRAVMPGKLDDFTQQIIAGLPGRSKGLPRAQQMSLWVLTGVPVDPSQTPAVLNVIQGMYASEPGTQGGTQAPTPQPQFGSVRADKGTAAQQRQGENT